jgi:hypothetical protein
MQPLVLWCISACLFTLAGIVLTFAVLHYGGGRKYKNRRYAELIWQSQNRDLEWWYDEGQRHQ